MFDLQRYHDIVRFFRSEALDEGLIDEEEYSNLVTNDGPASVARLMSYDEMKKKLSESQALVGELTKALAKFEEVEIELQDAKNKISVMTSNSMNDKKRIAELDSTLSKLKLEHNKIVNSLSLNKRIENPSESLSLLRDLANDRSMRSMYTMKRVKDYLDIFEEIEEEE